MRFSFKYVVVLAVVWSLAACRSELAVSAATLTEEQTAAVCLISSYAERNGFYGALDNPDYEEIQLLGYDVLEYVVDGETDWDRLLAERENGLTHLLNGVSRAPDDEGWYTVYFDTEPFDLCQEAHPESGEIIFSTTRGCLREDTAVEVNLSEIVCGEY